MSTFELISIIIAGVSVIISTLSIIIALGANKTSSKLSGYYIVERNNQFVSGQTELQLNQTIDETKRHVMNVTYKLIELPIDTEDKVRDLLIELFDSALESNGKCM